MSEVPDERLVYTKIKQASQHDEYVFCLAVGYNTRQNGDRNGAALFEHAHKVKIIVHDLDGNVDIIGSCVGKLLGKLLCRAHLIDHDRIGHGALPRGKLRHGQAAARLRYRAALVERRYKLAAQLVNLGRGEIKSALHPALRIHAVVRRTACLAEPVAQDLGIYRLTYRLLRLGAESDYLVSAVIYSCGLDGLSGVYDCVKLHRNAALFLADVLFSCVGKHFFADLVGFGSHAEHVGLVAVKIALRKALTGKCVGEGLQLLLRRLAALFDYL